MAPDWEDEFLTVNEIAEHLRLNQQTVRNWIDQGRLRAVRVGRRVRVRRTDLDHLVSEGATVAGDPPEAAPQVSADSRDQFARAVQSARDVLGRLSAARRSELAVALHELVQAGDQLLHALDADPGHTPTADADGAVDSSP
jgi:excisionase family DNA binding protein